MGGVKPFTATMRSISIVKGYNVPTSFILSTYGEPNDNRFNNYQAYIKDNINGGGFAVGDMRWEGDNSTNGLVVKYNEDLTISNSRRIAGSGDVRLRAAVEDGSGGCIAVGYITTGSYSFEGLVVHLDSTLDVIASFSMGDDDSFDIGAEFLNSVTKIGSNYIAFGSHETATTSPNDPRGYMVVFDSSLNVISQTQLASGAQSLGFGKQISDGGTGFYVLGGSPNNGNFVTHIDSNLDIIKTTLLSPSSGSINFTDITSDGSGGCVVAGYTDAYVGYSGDHRGYILRLDSNLNLLSEKVINDSDIPIKLHGVSKVGSKFLAVGHNEKDTAQDDDAYIIEFDNNLNISSTIKLSGDADNRLFGVESYGNDVFIHGLLSHNNGFQGKASLLTFSGSVSSIVGSLNNHDLVFSSITMNTLTSNASVSNPTYSTSGTNPTIRTGLVSDGTVNSNYINLLSDSLV